MRRYWRTILIWFLGLLSRMFKMGEELQIEFGCGKKGKERRIGYKHFWSLFHPLCPRLSKFPNLVNKDKKGVFWRYSYWCCKSLTVVSNKYTVRDDNTNSTITQSTMQNPGKISLCSPADLSQRTKGLSKIILNDTFGFLSLLSLEIKLFLEIVL